MLSKDAALERLLGKHSRRTSLVSIELGAGLANGRIEDLQKAGVRDARNDLTLENNRYLLRTLFGLEIGYIAPKDPTNPLCPEYDGYQLDLEVAMHRHRHKL